MRLDGGPTRSLTRVGGPGPQLEHPRGCAREARTNGSGGPQCLFSAEWVFQMAVKGQRHSAGQ